MVLFSLLLREKSPLEATKPADSTPTKSRDQNGSALGVRDMVNLGGCRSDVGHRLQRHGRRHYIVIRILPCNESQQDVAVQPPSHGPLGNADLTGLLSVRKDRMCPLTAYIIWGRRIEA